MCFSMRECQEMETTGICLMELWFYVLEIFTTWSTSLFGYLYIKISIFLVTHRDVIYFKLTMLYVHLFYKTTINKNGNVLKVYNIV